MKKKLTLTIDDKAIENGRKFAKEESRSLSSLVEQFLKNLKAN